MEQNLPPTVKTADFSKTLPPETTPGETLYSPMLQGTGTNRLTQISTRETAPEVDAITGLATITSGNLTVFIEKYNALEGGLRISTHKLLDACTIALTAQNDYRGNGNPNTEVIIPLEDYMEKRGKPLTKACRDRIRKEVKKDLEALYSTSIEWSEPGRTQARDFAKMRICDRIAIKNGNIMMNFSTAIAQYLNHAYIMQYPLELLKVDERNPSSYTVGRKLLQHYSMDNNQLKGTATMLSVKVLLENMRHIPSYADVMRTDRHAERRIITPFENTLNALSSILTWEYSNSKGVPLTEEQIQNFTYEVFIDCYVHYSPINAPDPNPRLQAKAEQAKKEGAKASKKRRTYRKKRTVKDG